MSKPICIVILILCACVAGLNAQAPPIRDAPDGTVGVPYFFDFFGASLTLSQFLMQCASQASDVTCTYDFKLTRGTLPPGLSLDSNGAVSGTPTMPGDYDFTITLNYVISSVTGVIFPVSSPVTYSMRVTGYSGAPVSVYP